jgi:hypothetical protein
MFSLTLSACVKQHGTVALTFLFLVSECMAQKIGYFMKRKSNRRDLQLPNLFHLKDLFNKKSDYVILDDIGRTIY